MKQILVALLTYGSALAFSASAFAATTDCDYWQGELHKAKMDYNAAQANLEYSYQVCPTAPSPRLCNRISQNHYQQTLNTLIEVGTSRNLACQ